ncbi:MAG TPA: M23 family metallopeptidase [Rectinemataceae bacterium]|nr:M23 family metallopeptidase [Rectinemataceae bacterium]
MSARARCSLPLFIAALLVLGPQTLTALPGAVAAEPGAAAAGPGPAGAPAPSAAPAPAPAGNAAAQGAVLVAPDSLRQGDPLLAWVISAEAGAYEARLESEAGGTAATAPSFDASSLAPGPKASKLRLSGLLIPIPMDFKPGPYRLVVRGPRSVAGSEPPELVHRLSIAARAFPLESIPLDAKNAELLTAPDPRKEAEAKAFNAIFATVDPEAGFLDGSAFSLPVDSKRRTAGFGDKRRYLYPSGGSDSSVHQGIDFAAPQGSPVLASARGKVVFAAERIVTGNTVVIEHLPGLYSIYMHFSKIEAAEGQMVERGQRIGLSGSTGLSTGPHLHWELRARGLAVDPEFWLARPPLDNETLIAKMAGLIEGR